MARSRWIWIGTLALAVALAGCADGLRLFGFGQGETPPTELTPERTAEIEQERNALRELLEESKKRLDDVQSELGAAQSDEQRAETAKLVERLKGYVDHLQDRDKGLGRVLDAANEGMNAAASGDLATGVEAASSGSAPFLPPPWNLVVALGGAAVAEAIRRFGKRQGQQQGEQTAKQVVQGIERASLVSGDPNEEPDWNMVREIHAAAGLRDLIQQWRQEVRNEIAGRRPTLAASPTAPAAPPPPAPPPAPAPSEEAPLANAA